MQSSQTYIKRILIFDGIIFLFCLVGIYQISAKANLPFEITSSNTNLITANISRSSDKFKYGDIIISINEYKFISREEVELFLDGKNIGDTVNVKYKRKNKIAIKQVELTNFYSFFYVVMAILVGIVFFVAGIFVFFKSEQRSIAHVFHGAAIAIGIIIMTTWGNYTTPNFGFGLFTRFLFHLGYSFVPVLFLHFAFIFPSQNRFFSKRFLFVLYLIPLLFTIILSSIFSLYAMNNTSIHWMRVYITYYNICSIFVAGLTIGAIAIFFHTYKNSNLEVERKKLRWMLLGFIIGPGTYIIFWVIPQRITTHGLLPESLVVLLIMTVPITFGIAIVKHRLMDIDFILNRGFVYTIVTAGLLVIYIVIMIIISSLISTKDSNIPSVAVAVAVTLMFQPVRAGVQRFVDKKFFRVQYDLRKEFKVIIEEIEELNNTKTLADKIVEKINQLIPIKKVGLLTLDLPENRIHVLAHNNFNILKKRGFNLKAEKLQGDFSLPLAITDKVELNEKVKIINMGVFQRCGISLVFIIKSDSNEIFGFLVLGEKKSETRYTNEDIDLLNTLVSRTSAIVKRIKLQEDLILEQLETERLEELNRLKSYFVSSVSHDLKTPLTSIKMFAEILKSSKSISAEKVRAYLEIIEGESNRLTRLIDNVLDYSKIERGVKEYNFTNVNLNSIILEVLNLMEYQFKMKQFSVHTYLYENDLIISADRDAVIETIINLLSNAIKFSKDNKTIIIKTDKQCDFITLEVNDKGFGISEEDLKNLFSPYFRSKELKTERAGGVGLGLSIVKHFMDAHNGKINVSSIAGKGSTFTLLFPLKGIK